MIGMMWLLRNPAVSASIHLKMMKKIMRLGRSQASINLNRLETHGMTLPLSLIESKVLFGIIESLRFSDLISESHQNQSKPRFGDLVCR